MRFLVGYLFILSTISSVAIAQSSAPGSVVIQQSTTDQNQTSCDEKVNKFRDNITKLQSSCFSVFNPDDFEGKKFSVDKCTDLARTCLYSGGDTLDGEEAPTACSKVADQKRATFLDGEVKNLEPQATTTQQLVSDKKSQLLKLQKDEADQERQINAQISKAQSDLNTLPTKLNTELQRLGINVTDQINKLRAQIDTENRTITDIQQNKLNQIIADDQTAQLDLTQKCDDSALSQATAKKDAINQATVSGSLRFDSFTNVQQRTDINQIYQRLLQQCLSRQTNAKQALEIKKQQQQQALEVQLKASADHIKELNDNILTLSQSKLTESNGKIAEYRQQLDAAAQAVQQGGQQLQALRTNYQQQLAQLNQDLQVATQNNTQHQIALSAAQTELTQLEAKKILPGKDNDDMGSKVKDLMTTLDSNTADDSLRQAAVNCSKALCDQGKNQYCNADATLPSVGASR